jgi:hypothetical protein
MTLRVAPLGTRAQLDGLCGQLSGGTLRIYDGSQPPSAVDAASGTLLASLTLPSPAFLPAASVGSGSVASASALLETRAAVSNGIAGWFRASTASGNVTVFDGRVIAESALPGDGQLVVEQTNITVGGYVGIVSWVMFARESDS